jgi:hypothetical protein
MMFKEWLGVDGVDFFTKLYEKHGSLRVVPYSVEEGGLWMQSPVHNREGRQVRNWMRDNTNIEEADLDDVWELFVIKQLGLEEEW